LTLLDDNCKRLSNFRGQNERSFRAYLREISFHITVDFLRKKRNFIDIDQIQYCISTKNDYEMVDYGDLEKTIMTLRKELSQRHNYLFKLIYEEELDFAEIAEILNIKLNALHQLKFRMIKNIIKISKRQGLYNELKIFMTDLCGIGIGRPDVISVN
jgi:RNA polymerase sigma factor (sigma-70 family)